MFREVVRQHFFHKRAAVAEQLQLWADQSSPAQRSAMDKLADDAETALMSLVSEIECSASDSCTSGSDSSNHHQPRVSAAVDLASESQEDRDLAEALRRSTEGSSSDGTGWRGTRREDSIVID